MARHEVTWYKLSCGLEKNVIQQQKTVQYKIIA